MGLPGPGVREDLTATRRAAFLAALCLASCATPPPHRGHATPFPARVVLLPLANRSNNLQAPILARHLLLQHLGGAVTPLAPAEVDRRQRAMGVTDGGQLAALSPAALGATLAADALLEGEITVFSNTNIGVFSRRKVEIALRLVDAPTGQVLWSSTRAESTSKAALDKDAIERNLIVGYGTKLIEGALKSPLAPECAAVCRLLSRDLSRARNTWN